MNHNQIYLIPNFTAIKIYDIINHENIYKKQKCNLISNAEVTDVLLI